MNMIRFQCDRLTVEVHPDAEACGRAAAHASADALRQLAHTHETFAVVFATGASQLPTLRGLLSQNDLPWNRITGFHLDEYIGLDVQHPASFRRYLRENLTAHVAMRAFFEIDGNAPDPEAFCRQYARRLSEFNPQLCFLGIGDNGHLAFNDPAEADFADPKAMKAVQLDSACRRQQAEEGWFPTLDDVPSRALTLTIPTIMRIPRLIVSAPGARKAAIVKRTLHDPVSETCPATILRSHSGATLFLDAASAAQLDLHAEM
jgi:glucosamine-6-phosphate deaminase